MAIAIASVSVEALASVAIARDSHAGGAQLPSPASQSPQVLTLASADCMNVAADRRTADTTADTLLMPCRSMHCKSQGWKPALLRQGFFALAQFATWSALHKVSLTSPRDPKLVGP